MLSAPSTLSKKGEERIGQSVLFVKYCKLMKLEEKGASWLPYTRSLVYVKALILSKNFVLGVRYN
jgi:hypothetical protein